jgi:hypothetical protein
MQPTRPNLPKQNSVVPRGPAPKKKISKISTKHGGWSCKGCENNTQGKGSKEKNGEHRSKFQSKVKLIIIDLYFLGFLWIVLTMQHLCFFHHFGFSLHHFTHNTIFLVVEKLRVYE